MNTGGHLMRDILGKKKNNRIQHAWEKISVSIFAIQNTYMSGFLKTVLKN